MNNIEIKQSKSYNKTLVVGHTLLEYESVMALLTASGMSLAKPLKKELIAASDISNTLLKAHEDESSNFEQLKINQVWDGLALDLLMSNIEQKWWGWADSQAISLLDYWKSIDSKIAFILIYDTPENFIKRTLNNLDVISSSHLQKEIDNWCDYNRELLKFYYRNPDNTLLINIQEVKTNSLDYLEQVSNQLGIQNTNIENDVISSIQQTFNNEEHEDALFSYLVKDLLEEYPSLVSLFEELQSVANLPFSNIEKIKCNAFDGISSLLKEKEKQTQLRTQLVQVQDTLEESYLENQTTKKEFSNLTKSFTEKKEENSKLTIQLESEKKRYQSLSETAKENSTENELLLSQLMQVQETLEESYLDNQKTKKEFSSLIKSLTEKKEENSKLTIQLESEKKRYQSLSETAKENSSENELLLSQLMQVQETLEESYLDNQKTKKEFLSLTKSLTEKKEENSKLTIQLESEKKRYQSLSETAKENSTENELLLSQLMQVQETLEESYLDNQKTKKEFSSLTKSLTEKKEENSHFTAKLTSEKKKYDNLSKKAKENSSENELLLSEITAKLASEKKKYDDLNKKAKENSSENELLLNQLMQVQETLEESYLENVKLQETIKGNSKLKLYGAGERVKAQLNYRLGSKMIEKSKSFFGILSLPFALRGVHVEYKKDMRARKGKKLPPIESYADAYEAERIRKHLSYRLGEAMLESFSSTFGFFKLPWNLKKAYREFKEDRLNA